MNSHRGEQGFALPTVVLAGLLTLMMLAAALTALSGTRVALDEQYYAQLAREAAEAGWIKAETCIAQYSTPGWNDTDRRLTPQSDCNGNATGINCSDPNPACYVVLNGNIKTSFSVGAVTQDTGGRSAYAVTATVAQTKTSNPAVVWRTATTTLSYQSLYVSPPVLSGGAGWADGGHIGYISTYDNQLYGFGANYAGQLSDSATPTSVAAPLKIALPTGVTYVKKMQTSGQGASFMCIIGNDDMGYCRGNTSGFGGIPAYWQAVNVPANTKVYDITVNGYGGDRVCVLAGLSDATKQAYCWGDNDHGALGRGSSAGSVAFNASPVAFILPGGVYATKLFNQSQNVCVITSDSKLYCSGASWAGQIAGTYDEYDNWVKTPVQYALPAMGNVARASKDVLITYHSGYSNILVLATDGTIWASGDRNEQDGDTAGVGVFGNGVKADNTGDSSGAAPDLFGQNYATGGAIKMTNYSTFCIDNNDGSSSNGNKVQVWACDPASGVNPVDEQQWFFTDTTNAIWNPDTGKCLDLYNNNTTDGTVIQLYTCNNVAAQQWAVNADGTIRHIASGKCITVSSASNGSQLKLYTCSGSNYQKFTVTAPTQPWKAMISISSHESIADSFCGLRSDSTTGIWCAGYNEFGQLANIGTALGGGASGASCTSPAQAITMNMAAGVKVDYTKLTSEWQSQVDALQVIGTDGNVYGGGRNIYGKLGNGALGDAANNYRQCSTVKMALPSGVTAIGMSTRDEFSTYVLGSDGRVYASGRNNVGQLGDGTTNNRSAPVVVRVPRFGTIY